MPFSPSRPDRSLLARIPFGDDWLTLDDPSDRDVCDPYDARARMSLYRLLVERSNPHGAMGRHDEHSPFWGYASQLAWQHRSGRLAHESVSSPRIDESSWWGACNYSLSVVPYLGAMQLGLVPRLRFAREPPTGAYPYGEAIAAWVETFRVMHALRPGDPLEPIRFATWRAHLISIRAAVDASRAEFGALASTEQRFARGWVRMVDLFGIAAVRTDLELLALHGSGALPGRLLCAADEHDASCDLPRAEKSAMRDIVALSDRPEWRWALEVSAWRRIMRSQAAREDIAGVMAALFGRGRRVWSGRMRTAAYAALPVPLIDGTRQIARRFTREG